MESIEESMMKLKGDVGGWEEGIFHWACSLAKSMAKDLLEKIDQELMQSREKGLEIEGVRERWVTTLFGDVKIRRRLYRDSQGNYCFLLDEAMGLRKGSQASPKVEELATFLASYLPFEKCERLLRALLPDGLSHTTIHRLVGKVADPYLAEEEKEIEEVFEDGVIPQSEERVVPYLMVEADGVSIALQREEERRAEVKVGIAYEGWQPVGKDRYRLKEKMSYAGIMDGERFWEGFSLNLAKRYDLSEVGKVIVGGDGATWAREGAQLLGGVFQLSRFHLRRALLRGLKGDVGLANQVYQACLAGDGSLADTLLIKAQSLAGEEEGKDIAQLRGYLIENACGLADYRLEVKGDGLRGIGAIEGNVDKLIASRMKKRGMSWTKDGGNRMARLINLREREQLHCWINHRPDKAKSVSPVGKKIQTSQWSVNKDSGAWLESGLPTLYGPHAYRPWTHVLLGIARRASMRNIKVIRDSTD
jgi:hypothetical protein